MSFTNAQLAQKISDLIAYWASFNEEHANWLGGTIAGGPNSDGEYPLTDYTGTETLVKSPAKLQDDVDNITTGATAQANAAAASAAAAATSESNASTSAATATAQAALADADRVAAELAETNATNAQVTAVAQANLATDRAGYASEWAITVEDTLVSVAAGGNGTTDYSSLHWAAKSNASATASAASAAAALVSETNAAASAAAAATFDPVLYAALADNETVTGQYTFSHASGILIGAAPLTAALIGQWNTAYSWGDHAGLYSLAAHTHEGTAIDATAVTDGYVLTADGAGNAVWEAAAAAGDPAELGTLTQTDTFLYLNRNNVSNPVLHVAQVGAGPIARFGKVPSLGSTGYTAEITFNNNGSITAEGLTSNDLITTSRLSANGGTSGDSHLNWSSNGQNYLTHKTGQFTRWRSFDGVSTYTTKMELDDTDLKFYAGNTGALEITGSSYKLNPAGIRIGQYTATQGYIQAPAGGSVAIWTDGTGEIARFDDDGSAHVPQGTLQLGKYATTAGGVLKINGTTINKQAELQCTNGNLHIDANQGQYIYLNYYSNNAGTYVSSNGGFAGTNQFTGEYGSISLIGTKGGYGGVSLNNYFVLMNSGSSHVGMYNDVNNQWMWLAYPQSRLQLYYNGTQKMSTESYGVLVAGNVRSTDPGSGQSSYFENQNFVFPYGTWGNDVLHAAVSVRGGGYDSTVSASTGHCRIKFPAGTTSDNVMMTMMIHGYNYAGTKGAGDGGAWCIQVSGYYYAAENWNACSARIVTGSPPFDRVYFGEAGTSKYLLLGTSATQWDYPKVWITDFTTGHSHQHQWTDSSFTIDFSASTPTGWVGDSTSSPIYLGGQLRWDGETGTYASSMNLGGRLTIGTGAAPTGQNGDIHFKY